MILVAAGDSFTYGMELAPSGYTTNKYSLFEQDLDDDDLELIDQHRLYHSWPGVLGRLLGARKVVNLGKSGLGCHLIARSVVEWISLNEEIASDAMVVIGWTDPGRFDYIDPRSGEWDTISPRLRERTSTAKFYYDNMYSEQECVEKWFTQMIFLQNLLDKIGARHFMFNALANLSELHVPSSYMKFMDMKNAYLDLSMMRYCSRKGYGYAPGGHFREDGHEEWARYLADTLRTRGIVNI